MSDILNVYPTSATKHIYALKWA